MVKSTKTQKTVIDEDLVRQLAALLDETGLNEIEYANDVGVGQFSTEVHFSFEATDTGVVAVGFWDAGQGLFFGGFK